jgi:predicted Zn-dependent protease
LARLRTFLLLLLFGSALALVLSPGCMRDPVTGRLALGFINPSDAEEVRMGREAAASFITASDGVYPDAGAAAYLDGIVRRLGAASHRPGLPYRITLLNSPVPNAFALPGGHVFLSRGLLLRLENEAEFAFVMAHEIGHVNHRHAVKAMNDSLVVGLGGSVLAGSVEDERRRQAAAGLASVGGGLVLLRFSRGQELESDARGAEYALRAGYDPRAGLRVFEEFARQKRASGKKAGPLDAWISSHPLDAERIEHLREEIGKRRPALRGDAPAPGLARTTPAWAALLARVRAAEPAYARLDRARAAAARALASGDRAAAERARREVAEAGRALPGHALFPAVEGAMLQAMGDRPAARARLEEAVRLQPDLQFARVRLAALEADDGRFARAAVEAGAAADLDPASAEARILLGRALEGTGDRAGSRAAYEEAVRLAARGSPEERHALARLAALEPRR